MNGSSSKRPSHSVVRRELLDDVARVHRKEQGTIRR